MGKPSLRDCEKIVRQKKLFTLRCAEKVLGIVQYKSARAARWEAVLAYIEKGNIADAVKLDVASVAATVSSPVSVGRGKDG